MKDQTDSLKEKKTNEEDGEEPAGGKVKFIKKRDRKKEGKSETGIKGELQEKKTIPKKSESVKLSFADEEEY